MISAQAHVAAAVGIIGRPYGTGPRRLESYGPYTDCSGLVAIAHRLAGGGEVGAYTSGALYALCRDRGHIMGLAAATQTVGALLFLPENPLLGIGPAGHVALVRSPGVTIEGRGGYGVGSWAISRLSWSSKAGLLPSVTYGGGPAPSPPPPSPGATVGIDMASLTYSPRTTGDTWYADDGFFARPLASYAEAEELAGANQIPNIRNAAGRLYPKAVNGTRLAKRVVAYRALL
jgi:cell wall-associated NlpC family hydrolase